MVTVRENETFIVEYYIAGKKMPEIKEFLEQHKVKFRYKQTGLIFTFYVETNLSDVIEKNIHEQILKNVILL